MNSLKEQSSLLEIPNHRNRYKKCAMDAHLLSDVIRNIKADEEHHNERRIFHENYEWLEHYWKENYRNKNGTIDDFILNKGDYYWNLPDIQSIAISVASLECVGSNRNPDSTQTKVIANATMYLRYYCNLFNDKYPTCDTVNCRQHKKDIGRCIMEDGLLWSANFSSRLAFKAVIYIVRQVRNNLFHGQKLSLEPFQFERNKVLIHHCAGFTDIFLSRLIESEY